MLQILTFFKALGFAKGWNHLNTHLSHCSLIKFNCFSAAFLETLWDLFPNLYMFSFCFGFHCHWVLLFLVVTVCSAAARGRGPSGLNHPSRPKQNSIRSLRRSLRLLEFNGSEQEGRLEHVSRMSRHVTNLEIWWNLESSSESVHSQVDPEQAWWHDWTSLGMFWLHFICTPTV